MIGLRLSPELTDRIDSWAESRDLSRSEAMRQLIEQALESHSQANMRRRK
jgi:predicted transcriptional regulator